MYYIINEKHEVTKVEDVLEWGKWWESTRTNNLRRVGKTEFPLSIPKSLIYRLLMVLRLRKTKFGRQLESKSVEVSTVFLGLNHSWREDTEPVLFETLVFGGKLDGEMNRYCTWDEAEKGHAEMVEKVRSEL